jgi:hypothetical protein
METNWGILTITVLALAFFGAIFAGGATEISVPVMKMGNLSVDLGPNYILRQTCDQGSDLNPSGIGAKIDYINDPEAMNAVVTVSPK